MFVDMEWSAYENDIIILLDLLHELLEALLKLTPILGARHQQAHVQRDNLQVIRMSAQHCSL